MRIYLKTSKHFKPEDIFEVKAGDKLIFDMPPFCSGDYEAKVKEDQLGLYVKSKDCWFEGYRNYWFYKKEENVSEQ